MNQLFNDVYLTVGSNVSCGLVLVILTLVQPRANLYTGMLIVPLLVHTYSKFNNKTEVRAMADSLFYNMLISVVALGTGVSPGPLSLLTLCAPMYFSAFLLVTIRYVVEPENPKRSFVLSMFGSALGLGTALLLCFMTLSGVAAHRVANPRSGGYIVFTVNYVFVVCFVGLFAVVTHQRQKYPPRKVYDGIDSLCRLMLIFSSIGAII